MSRIVSHGPGGHGHTIHGHTGTGNGSITYNRWGSMKSRCNNPNDIGYANYGGRGIVYDPRWNYFENFLEDMGECPVGLTLDRIDNDKGYYKENCRWATRKVQNRNSRINHFVEYQGEIHCISEWAEILNLDQPRFRRGINLGWSMERAIEFSKNAHT